MITWSNLQWTCTQAIRISLIISWSLISQNHYDSESMTLMMPILSFEVIRASVNALEMVIIFEYCNCQEQSRRVRRLFKCVVIFDHHNRRLSCRWSETRRMHIFLKCVVIFYNHRHNPDQFILIMLVIRDEESEDILEKLRPAADWIEEALQVWSWWSRWLYDD